jgi:hypothetical protein
MVQPPMRTVTRGGDHMPRRYFPRPITTPRLDRASLLRLVAESLTDARSVVALVEGRPVRDLTATRVREAARRLGIALPPTADAA